MFSRRQALLPQQQRSLSIQRLQLSMQLTSKQSPLKERSMSQQSQQIRTASSSHSNRTWCGRWAPIFLVCIAGKTAAALQTDHCEGDRAKSPMRCGKMKSDHVIAHVHVVMNGLPMKHTILSEKVSPRLMPLETLKD